uniref:Calx-beta domain-containing protein n=1 Tax=Zooxanthella nutricula TaxID=1333877 RepID=A0A7S2I1U0_9DINO
MFMAAIERITSKQRKVRIPGTERLVTVQVWNETVANLTLMALGSSAPEILLSLNDVFKNEFFEGKLGPSTIVGSAAFNLFVIIAVCVNSIPNGEVRVIKEVGVFVVTAIWSIFAYVWLLFIVHFNTRNVIEVWEGVMTFFFFPMLVISSYATDVGWLTLANIKAFFCPCCYGKEEVEAVKDDDESDYEFSLIQFVCWLCFSVVSFVVRMIAKVASVIFNATIGCLCRRACNKMKKQGYEKSDGEAKAEEEDASQGFTMPPMADVVLDEDGEPIDWEQGVFSFASDSLKVWGGEDERSFTVTIYRRNGDTGRVTFTYKTIALTAVPGYDYVEVEDELQFRDGIKEQQLDLKILAKAHGEQNDKFQLIILDENGEVMFNPERDGGEEKNILTVEIINENPRPRTIKERFLSVCDRTVNCDEMRLGTVQWIDQFWESVYVNGTREAQEQAGIAAWIVHMIWLPWKVPLAMITPPPTFLGGWVCFVFSLLGIGFLTIIIGDLAELFGCALGIEDAITAISIVALGTSVPDLFASRAAAKQDEYADASIVNVTGSNSVNVFLGIGLPWMWASLYWSIGGANDKWRMKYSQDYGAEWGQNGAAVFIVNGGMLFFSVTVFTLTACVCLTVIGMRRWYFGGELGGPSDPKAYSSFLLISLWFLYIALSVWKFMTGTEELTKQILALSISIPVIVVLMIMFAVLLQALKISKKYIGEEGFWGIFISICVVGGRMAIFFVFQNEPS